MSKDSPFSKDDWTIRALNIHGIFFEQSCRYRIAQLRDTGVVTANYPVAFMDDAGVVHSSNLDIWADSFHEKIRLSFLIECKKNNPQLTEWIFFERQRLNVPPGFIAHEIRFASEKDKLRAKPGIFRFWMNTPVFEDARETKGTFTGNAKKDFTRTSNAAITDAANQVTIAFKDLFSAHSLQYNKSLFDGKDAPNFERHIFIPCIVTSARLFHCIFDPTDVDGRTGEIASDKVHLAEIPFAVFEYPLLRHSQYKPSNIPDVQADLITEGFVRLQILVLHSENFTEWIGPNLKFLSHSEDSKVLSEAQKLLVDAITDLQVKRNYRISTQMSFGDKTTDIAAEINGENHEIHMSEIWLKSVDGDNWISRDAGSTWKTTAPDPYLVAVLEAPISGQFKGPLGASRPRVEEVDRKETDSEAIIHLRVVPSGLDSSLASVVPEYWIRKTADCVTLQRFVGPTWFFKKPVIQRAEYTRRGDIGEISKPETADVERKQE